MNISMVMLTVFKYVISFLTCMVFFNTVTGKRYKRWWIVIVCLVIFILSYVFLNKYLPIEFLGDMMSILGISFMYEASLDNKIKNGVIVYVIWEIIQTVVGVAVYINVDTIYESIIEQLIDLGVFVLVYVLTDRFSMIADKIKEPGRFGRVIKNIIYILFVASITYMLLLIALSDYTQKNSTDTTIKRMFGYFVVPSLISLCVLVILFAYVIVVNMSQKKMIENEKQFNQMQHIYYETIISKEENTKRFRHDITNHLLYIYNMAKEYENNNIVDYIENIERVFSVKKNIIKNVGDETINILLNYYIGMLDESVDVRIEGMLTDNICESPLYTNLIIGNVLKNAIEELNKETKENMEIKNKKLYIKFYEGEQYRRITVVNTTINDKSKWKNEKNVHGYGTSIINDNVKKCNGQFVRTIKDGQCKAVITLEKPLNEL